MDSIIVLPSTMATMATMATMPTSSTVSTASTSSSSSSHRAYFKAEMDLLCEQFQKTTERVASNVKEMCKKSFDDTMLCLEKMSHQAAEDFARREKMMSGPSLTAEDMELKSLDELQNLSKAPMTRSRNRTRKVVANGNANGSTSSATSGATSSATSSASSKANPNSKKKTSTTRKKQEVSPLSLNPDEVKNILETQPILTTLVRFYKEIGGVNTCEYCPLILPFSSSEEEKKSNPHSFLLGFHMRNLCFALNEVIKNIWLKGDVEENVPSIKPVKIAQLRSVLKRYVVECSDAFQEQALEFFPYTVASTRKKTDSKTPAKKNASTAELYFVPDQTMNLLVQGYAKLYPKSKTEFPDEEEDPTREPFSFRAKNNSKYIKRVGIKENEQMPWNEKSFAVGFVPLFGVQCCQEFFRSRFLAWNAFLKSDLFRACYPLDDLSTLSSSTSSNVDAFMFPFQLGWMNSLVEQEPLTFSSVINTALHIPAQIIKNKALWPLLFTVRSYDTFWNSGAVNKCKNDVEKIKVAISNQVEKEAEEDSLPTDNRRRRKGSTTGRAAPRRTPKKGTNKPPKGLNGPVKRKRTSSATKKNKKQKPMEQEGDSMSVADKAFAQYDEEEEDEEGEEETTKPPVNVDFNLDKRLEEYSEESGEDDEE